MFNTQEKLELERLLWISIKESVNNRDRMGVTNALFFIEKLKAITPEDKLPESAESV